MKKRILISGVSPGPAGVGRVLEYLIINSNNYKFIFPPLGRKISFKELFNSFNLKLIFLFFSDFLRYYYYLLLFKFNIKFIKKKHILILHPQTIGLKNVKRLICNNDVSIYVMDNSFFCIKSYNYLGRTEKACLLCLDLSYKNAEKNNCTPFPIKYRYDEFFDFLTFLDNYKYKINFITQNKGQIDLLKHQFGNDISYTEIGLLTSDMFEKQTISPSYLPKKYDVVFHGDESPAKGSKYILDIAVNLPELTFLFPFNTNSKQIPNNIDFIKMNWTTGLKEHVQNSKITLCPSIWSAPIEGSVVKTLNLGVALGVYDADYSFSKEIPSDSILKLTGFLDKDIILLRDFVLNEEYKTTSVAGKSFIDKKIASMILKNKNLFKL